MIEFTTHSDPRGELTVIEKCIPFEIKRVFYIRNVPIYETRGCHALRTCHQVLIPVVGTLTVWITDGVDDEIYRLSDPRRGLYIKPMEWCVLSKWVPGTTCLVLASHNYDEADYINDFNEFLKGVLGEGLLLH